MKTGNRETARLVEAGGGRALAVRCDVTRADDVKEALKKAAAAFERLDLRSSPAERDASIRDRGDRCSEPGGASLSSQHCS
jgi:NAD(P)-dependent dehydrogenase (short-subunit alcohol dehydrogenase family)